MIGIADLEDLVDCLLGLAHVLRQLADLKLAMAHGILQGLLDDDGHDHVKNCKRGADDKENEERPRVPRDPVRNVYDVDPVVDGQHLEKREEALGQRAKVLLDIWIILLLVANGPREEDTADVAEEHDEHPRPEQRPHRGEDAPNNEPELPAEPQQPDDAEDPSQAEDAYDHNNVQHVLCLPCSSACKAYNELVDCGNKDDTEVKYIPPDEEEPHPLCIQPQSELNEEEYHKEQVEQKPRHLHIGVLLVRHRGVGLHTDVDRVDDYDAGNGCFEAPVHHE
mmetsp:Transcript_103181/g.308228  ORF Transcript_103181/g.308228 Transcript_103181/m.308228 type:complete len:280 (-) Transcript_103181:199-1038(-)